MKPTTKNVLYMLKESNAIEEVYDRASLVDAHKAWKHIMKHDQITPEIIKETHWILMKRQPLSLEDKGEFRNRPVSIGGETKSLPRIVIESLVRDLCEEMNKSTLNQDPINYHLQFEGIHPFIDGNGRMGRILLNWHLVKRFNAPLLVYTEKDKHTYYMLFSSYRSQHFQKAMKQIVKSWGDAKSQHRSTDK